MDDGYFSLLWDCGERYQEWMEERKTGDESYIKDLNLDALYREVCRLGRFGERFDFEQVFLHPCAALSTVLYRQRILEALYENRELYEAAVWTVGSISESQKKLGHIRGTRDGLGQKLFYLQMLLEFQADMDGALGRLLEQLPLDSPLAEGIRRLAVPVSGQDACRKRRRLEAFLDRVRQKMPRNFLINKDLEQKCRNAVLDDTREGENASFLACLQEAASFFLEDYDFSVGVYQNDLTVLDKKIQEYVDRKDPELWKEADALYREYGGFSFWPFLQFANELVFYLACVRFRREYEKAGFPFCLPRFVVRDGGFHVRGAYDMTLGRNLFQRGEGFHAVANDYCFQGNQRLFLLTGANQGGKTTFLRSVGLIQCLAQIGMYVPAREAVLEMTGKVHTLFGRDEEETAMVGRFEQELQRMKKILDSMKAGDMILLNEPFTSTQRPVAVTLLKRLMSEFDRGGCVGGLVTHYHELIDELGEGRFYSLVAGMAECRQSRQRTFHILRQESYRQSYARDIAEQCGVTYEGLWEVLSAEAAESGG